MATKSEKCRVCGKTPLLKNEIGLNKKLIHRQLHEFFCLPCLAAYFETTVEELNDKIEDFKRQGCALFGQEPQKSQSLTNETRPTFSCPWFLVFYNELTLKAYRDNIPLGMFFSVEENAKKSWHPIGMPLLGASRWDVDMGGEGVFLPRDTSLTGCKNGTLLK